MTKHIIILYILIGTDNFKDYLKCNFLNLLQHLNKYQTNVYTIYIWIYIYANVYSGFIHQNVQLAEG